mgnify:CR=1 FL=1
MLVVNSVPYSSYFLKYKVIHDILDFLVNMVPSKVYPYFGEILVIASKRRRLGWNLV